jgi:hypothetical protein
LVCGPQPFWGSLTTSIVKESKMQNFDIILLSSILSTLFIVFLGFTAKELLFAGKRRVSGFENSPHARFIYQVGKIFDNNTQSMALPEKIAVIKTMERVLADMESDGVYFSEEVKIELEKKRKELISENSGLPSAEG